MSDDACAIVGMACIFPGAPSLSAYWDNLCRGVDAISEAPFERIHPVFFASDRDAPDRLTCRRGGFLEQYATFDPLRHGMPPQSVATTEPDQLLLLDLAVQALHDAGYDSSDLPRQRTGIVVGRGNYPGVGRARLDQYVRTSEQLVLALRDLVPGLSSELLERIRAEFQAKSGLPAIDDVIGLVPNLTASRIANRLDLRGTAFTLDAACASALVALEHATNQLRQAQADLMICAAAHLAHTESFWQVFQRLGALSHSGVIRPLAADADGTLIGEGLGVLVLKRLSDALDAGDRVYAVVRAVGCASDGRSASLMSPSVDGQTRALELAWAAARLDPIDLGLMEAHGTATRAGDSAEIETLRRFFGHNPTRRERIGIGCVKSMIGHAMPAAGMAGIIKTALAVYHAVQPPTLHCARPHEALEQTRFQPVQQARPWTSINRIAAVDAFGFGGINAHAVLQSAPPSRTTGPRAHARPTLPSPVLLERESAAQLMAALDAQTLEPGLGPMRLAMLDATPATRNKARRVIERELTSNGREGVFYARQRLLEGGGRLAFLFPGLDARFEPRVDDLAQFLGEANPEFTSPSTLEEHCAEILRVNMLVFRALGRLGIQPDLLAGHSIGEWAALAAGGVVEEPTLTRVVRSLRARPNLESNAIRTVAVGCAIATAEAEIDDLADLAISHDNCGHQIVICGPEQMLDVAATRFKARGVFVQALAFGSGVHSRYFAPQLRLHAHTASAVALRRPSIPIYSATSAAQMPESTGAIAELGRRLLVERVRFRELIERLYADGARVFVQVGAGSLVGFVDDILRGRPYACIGANVRQRSGLEQVVRTACMIWAHGGQANLGAQGRRNPAAARSMRLSLGVPMVRFDAPLPLPAASAMVAPAMVPTCSTRLEPLPALFLRNLEHLKHAQSAVISASQARAAVSNKTQLPTSARATSRTIPLSVQTLPELVDHAFDRQAPHWPVEETFPVVPMTGLVELMVRAAQDLTSSPQVTEVRDVVAGRWLAVRTPVQLEVTARELERATIAVELSDYASGVVSLASAQSHSISALPPRFVATRPAISAAELYGQGWMFHGPSYQVVRRIEAVGANAISGQLVDTGALGALLDGAGQLLGYWLMVNSTDDRLAMPTRIRRIRFHRRKPELGTAVSCHVAITRVDANVVEGDFHLSSDDGPWATVEGWQSRRFATPGRFFEVLRRPQHEALCEVPQPGLAIVRDIYNAATTRDYLVRRYLRPEERTYFAALGPSERRTWLNLQIAIKDATRSRSWQRDPRPIFPAEVIVAADRHTASIAETEVQLCTATEQGLWIAHAGAERAQLRVVRVSSPAAEAMRAALCEAELKLIPSANDGQMWPTRMGLVKRTVNELARGQAQIVDRRDDMLLANGHWFHTLHWDSYVICWSVT